MVLRIVVLALVLLVISQVSLAATIHVPADQPTIQAGIDAAETGDEVVVACGTYYEHGILMKSGVLLSSETGSYGCVTVDAGGSAPILRLQATSPDTRVEGITFTGANMGLASAIRIISADGTFRNCKFIGNTAGESGGAVYLSNEESDINFEGCWFEGNSAELDGGAVYAMAPNHLNFDGCTFTGNAAGRNGGAVLVNREETSFTACTFAANSAAVVGSSVTVLNWGRVSLDRCLVTGGHSGGAFYKFQGTRLDLTCSNVYGNSGGDWSAGQDGNICVDPQYCGAPGSGNYYLQSDSPCAPGNHPDGEDCGLIGALPVNCGETSVQVSTWSQVKSLY